MVDLGIRAGPVTTSGRTILRGALLVLGFVIGCASVLWLVGYLAALGTYADGEVPTIRFSDMIVP